MLNQLATPPTVVIGPAESLNPRRDALIDYLQAVVKSISYPCQNALALVVRPFSVSALAIGAKMLLLW